MPEVESREGTEEYYKILLGSGMYTSELASNIPDGFSPIAYNLVATGDSLENRIGIKRFSVDWKVMDDAPGSLITLSGQMYIFNQVDPWSKNPQGVAFAWAGQGKAVPGGGANSPTLNLIRESGTVGAGDGFMSVTMPNRVTGIAVYNNTLYFALHTLGIQKITNINWVTDTITYTAIAGAVGNYYGLFTFKDRLWAFNSQFLYFTDIAPVGGLPEVWPALGNTITFMGPSGYGLIQKVIPLGNRLIVFTTGGIYTLLVEGAPASWILRILDSKSISTSFQCAFESKGLVYYVNTQGVWATNGLVITKLSAVIEDQWFLAKGPRVHSICPYEDGMIVSVAKLTGANDAFFDKENCKVFYSKLDPIGWTEWNVNRYGMGAGAYNLAMIWSTTEKIPTYLNSEPTVYVMGLFTDSTAASPTQPVWQPLVMDSGEDQWVTRANVLETIAVGCYLKTKSFDGNMPYKLKHAIEAYLELYTSDVNHIVECSWDNDFTIDEATEIRGRTITDATVGLGSNLIRVLSDFAYRRAAFNLRASLQTANSQIKIKDLVLKQQTLRSIIEQVA